MMLTKLRTLTLSAALILPLYGCNASDSSNTSATDSSGADTSISSEETKVAATVNGTVITEKRVAMLAQQAAQQGQPIDSETRKGVIEQLTMQLLISKEAIKNGIDKMPEVIDQIDLIKQSILANAFVRQHMENTHFSDDALKAEYEKIKAQITGSEYKARHILVAKEAEAKKIITKLKKNPKSFEALAKKHSIDAGSKDNGGDLGWFDPKSMVPEFGVALEALEKGQFNKVPVKSPFGYHVILLEDTRSKMIPPLNEIKEALQQQLSQQSLKELFDELKAKATIEIVSTDEADEVDGDASADEGELEEDKMEEDKH